MNKSRYTESQIVNILKQNKSSITVAELCREYGMSQASTLELYGNERYYIDRVNHYSF
jgi:putative transposase